MNAPVHVTEEQLKRLQQLGLEMLIEVDRICRKNDIVYEMDGGTLLGAVRHKGFIPWDDDVDIRMLRDDYDRFCKACETDLDTSRFFLQNYNTDPEYRWGYGKILRKDTDFRRLGQDMLKMKRGVFLDIFNCDNMPRSGLEKNLFNFRCFIYRKIGYAPIGAEGEKNLFYKALYRLLRHIPISVIRKGFDRLAYQYNDKKTYYVRTTGWYYSQEDDGYLRRWMDDTCELEFEGHKFLAPKDYDGYLTQLYGPDYMTPPPKEKQIPENFASYMDLGSFEVNV